MLSDKKLYSRFKILNSIVFSLALLTILFGPYVRAEDAGLACPDWPLCHGYVIPPLDYQIYLEFIHRVLAAVLGIFFTIWFFWGILNPKLRKLFLPYFLLASVVLVMQIYLGRETITKQLNAYIVKFHLLNAIFFVSVIFFVLYRLHRIIYPLKINHVSIDKSKITILPFFVFLFLILIYLQIYFGGRVSANYVGLVCPEFPECYNEVIKNENQETINTVYIPPLKYGFEMHFTHRAVGFIIFFYSLYLWYLFNKNKILEKEILLLISMIALQIFLGIINIVFELPTLTRVIHSFLATAIFLTTFYVFLELKQIILLKNG